MDHLQALVKYNEDYRRSNIICVTETLFSEEKFHNPVIDRCTSVRLDRSKKKSSKEKGGGLVMYVDKDWVTNITVRETANTPDYEILHVSFCPHYLPREFTQVSVILVYVPGPNNNAAADHIADANCYNSALARSTDQPVILLGDFNTCDITKHLPRFNSVSRNPHTAKARSSTK